GGTAGGAAPGCPGEGASGCWEDESNVLENASIEPGVCQEMLMGLEAKQSESLSELITLREALESSHLEGELLRQEQTEVTAALARAEQSIAELSSSENTLKTEVADLRAAAVKLSALNEALALDKVGLNQQLLQLEEENQSVCSRMEAAEQARNALQVDLAEAEKRREALWEKNTHLEAQLQKAEEAGAELQADLRDIQEEKEEIQKKL
ncbi:CEP250 isoform 10, partial [Pan troglodytes]